MEICGVQVVKMLNDPYEVKFDNVPTPLEKEAYEYVRSQRLVAWHVVDRFEDLTFDHWGAQAMQIKWFKI